MRIARNAFRATSGGKVWHNARFLPSAIRTLAQRQNMLLQRYLLIWLVISSWIAFQWPSTWWDPFLRTAPYLKYMITVTMFAIGMMLPRDEVNLVIRRWYSVLGGTAIQYLAMPALGYLVGRAFGFEGPYLIGMVMVGCVPGAMASNVLTINAGGNASYSVSLTTMATLVSPLAVPLALALTLGAKSPEQKAILMDSAVFTLWSVVVPVVVGHVLARWTPDAERHYRHIGPLIANLVILWIIAVVVALNRTQLSSTPASMMVALLCVNAGGYAAGFTGGLGLRLPDGMRRALTLEVGMQNAGLGATLASHLFPDQPETAIAPAMYTFGCMLTGTILSRLWSLRGVQECEKSSSSSE